MRFSATLGIVVVSLLLLASSSAASVMPKVVAGDGHTCVLQNDSTVKCFGRNQHGQLGNTTLSNTATATTVAFEPGDVVKDITAGERHTCAILVGGSVKCWGVNRRGELGVATNAGTLQPNPVPLEVDLGVGAVAVAIDAGEEHTCVGLSDGTVKCFGNNQYGQLGTSTNNGNNDPNFTPQTASIGAGATPVSIAAGGTHTCVVLSDGVVKCFGSNYDGQLSTTLNNGIVAANFNAITVDLGNGAVATEIGAGAYHTCVLLSDGMVKCFGRNDLGQQGNAANVGNTNANPTPTAVDLAPGTTATSLAVGTEYSCVVSDAEDLLCFGLNYYGQLGFTANAGTLNANSTPTMAELGTGTNVRSVAAGREHSCALMVDGVVKCFGRNSFFEIGLTPTNLSANPTPNTISGLSNMVPVATSVHITSHADGFNTSANSTNLTFTSAGTGEVSCTLNGSPATSPVAVSLFTGPNTFTVACTSETGAASETITINRGSPATVQITVPDGHKTTDSSIPIFYTTSGTSPVSCTLAGNSFPDGSIINLGIGVNTITVSCSNDFGSDSSTVTIYRGTVPSVAITSPADGFNTADTSAQIEFTATGTAPVECYIGKTSVTSPTTVDLTPGVANTFEVECFNDYGDGSDTITINQGDAPSVVITPPAGGTTSTTGSTSIAFSSSGSGTVTCEYNGQPAVSPLNVTLTPGANLISIVCESEFGTTTQSFSINYVVPTPVVTKLGARIAKPRWKVKRANGKLKLSARVQVVGTGVNAASCVGTIRTSVKPTRANGKSAPGSGRAGKPRRSNLEFVGGKCVANVSLSLPAKYVRDAVRLSVINWLVGSKTLLAEPRSSRPKV